MTTKSSTGPFLRLWLAMGFFGLLGLIIVVFWACIAVFGPSIAPHDGGEILTYDVFSPLSAEYPLGTDFLGRDMLSRILYGARYTAGIAIVAGVLASSIGTGLALFAAVNVRWIDEVLSRLMDTLISIPSKVFALVMVAAFGSSIPLLLIIITVSYIPGAYRIARSLAVNLNQMEYVEVARARGEGNAYIAIVEILPNMLNPMLADLGLRFVFIVLTLSGLSFLGLGVQPPYADLGSLVRENISGLPEGAPALIFPALAIATLTIGVNMLVDSWTSRAGKKNHG